jgi:predicted ATP-dependent serine protease
MGVQQFTIHDLIGNKRTKGNLGLIYGNPNSGKTALAIDMAYEYASKGQRVIYIAFEGYVMAMQRIYSKFADNNMNFFTNISIVDPRGMLATPEGISSLLGIYNTGSKHIVDVVIFDDIQQIQTTYLDNPAGTPISGRTLISILMDICAKYEVTGWGTLRVSSESKDVELCDSMSAAISMDGCI